MSIVTRFFGFSFSVLSVVVQAADIPASGLAGNFAVSPMGAATYNIPLSLPAGVNGATPKLSLNYSSQSGMGIAGMGWNIGGLSAITRCPQSKAVDGVQKALALTADDRFCMDGQRLILMSGTYGAVGSTYRTEINNFARVTVLTHPSNSSLIYFKVETKDGKVLEYGSRLDAVLQPNAAGKTNFPLVWMISSNYDRDQKGQLIAYDYTNDNVNGQQTLSRVRYAYDVNNANNLVDIVFTYNTIPSTSTTAYPLSPVMNYMAGGSTSKRDKQLSSISVRSAIAVGQALNEIHNYQLIYEVAPNTRRQRLKEVKSCMPSGNCLPALQFESQNAIASVQSMFNAPSNPLAAFGTNQSWGNSSIHPRQFADINNDGLPDIVGFSDVGVVVALNNGNGGFNPAQDKLSAFGRGSGAGGWVDNNLHPRQLVDINGDSLPDVVGFSDAGVVVALNNGNGGFNPAQDKLSAFGRGSSAGGWIDNNAHPRQLVDINGDGLPDVVGFSDAGVVVALNNGNGGFNPAQDKLSAFGRVSIIENTGVWWDNNYHPRRFADMNGDGLVDIVGFNRGIFISLNDGNGGFSSESGESISPEDEDCNIEVCPRELRDMNGDGLADIVYFWPEGVKVYLNKGRGSDEYFADPSDSFSINFGLYVSAGSWASNATHPRQLADVNGDGLPDIVGFRDTSVHIALNTGKGFETPIILQNHFNTYSSWSNASIRTVFDINGDGSDDFVGITDNGVVTSLNKNNFKSDIINEFRSSTLMAVTQHIDYLPLTNNQVYVGGGQSTYPNYNLRLPMYVVSSVSTSNGVSGGNHNDYFYGFLTVNLTRGWQGFLSTAIVNREQKTRTDTIYNQTFPQTGMVSAQRIGYCATDACLKVKTTYPFINESGLNILSLVTNILEKTTTNGVVVNQKIYFPYVKSSTSTTYEPPVVSQ